MPTPKSSENMVMNLVLASRSLNSQTTKLPPLRSPKEVGKK
jgi:hypothetical protein